MCSTNSKPALDECGVFWSRKQASKFLYALASGPGNSSQAEENPMCTVQFFPKVLTWHMLTSIIILEVSMCYNFSVMAHVTCVMHKSHKLVIK